MSAIFKRAGLVFIAFDLLVGVASAAVLHHPAGASHSMAAGKMSAARLEQVVESSTGAANASCTSDPTAGWDYYCISSDGSRTLYDVSAGTITQRADLPSYR